MIDVINLAHSLKVKAIYFQYLEYIGIEDRKSELVGELDIKSLKEKLIAAARLAGQKRINTNLTVWLRDLNLYTNKMGPEENFKANHRKCYFPWFSTFIEVNGDVKPCPVVGWKLNEGKMGNVFEEEFPKIWNNTLYKQFHKELKYRRRPFQPCKTCIPQKLTNLIHITSKMLPKK